mgnify:CR=1 FL=1
MINLQFKLFNVFLMSIFFVVSFFLAVDSAEARRMGFGRSIGKPPPIKRQVAPPAQAPKKAIDKTPANSSNASVNKSRGGFMGPLAGLAAGLGLAALASYLGVGEELMSFLLILLAGVAVFFIIRLVLRNMQRQPSLEGVPSSFNRSDIDSNTIRKSSLNVISPHQQSQKDTISQEEINSFLDNSKKQFVEVQKIWDSGNINNLKTLCTDDLVSELSKQINEKTNFSEKTSITELDASWKGMNTFVNDEGIEVQEVYVLFSGMVRESDDSVCEEFSEVWTLQRFKSTGDGWLIAGITQQD